MFGIGGEMAKARGRKGDSQNFYQLKMLSLVLEGVVLHLKEGCSVFLSGLKYHTPSWDQDSSFSYSSSFSNGPLLQELHRCRSEQAVAGLQLEVFLSSFPSGSTAGSP